MPEQHVIALKVRLIRALREYSEENQLTQTEMAVLMETTQPRVSNLYKEHHTKFTLDVLFKWFYTLGIETQIPINHKGDV